jgi:hypothetical protein
MRCITHFDVLSWDEEPYDEPIEGPRLARAAVKKSFDGEMTGDSTAELLMCQANAANYEAGAGYVASERFIGSIGERSGAFVMQHGGVTGGGAEEKSFGHIVPGSGRGEFSGLHGTVEFRRDDDGRHTLILEYDFASSR